MWYDDRGGISASLAVLGTAATDRQTGLGRTSTPRLFVPSSHRPIVPSYPRPLPSFLFFLFLSFLFLEYSRAESGNNKQLGG